MKYFLCGHYRSTLPLGDDNNYFIIRQPLIVETRKLSRRKKGNLILVFWWLLWGADGVIQMAKKASVKRPLEPF
jgi:hypothetical protein